MKDKFIKFFFCFLILSNCGFKVSNDNLNFKISDISLAGDKKVNYLIKNKLLMASDNENKNLIQLKISTKKLKSIKEKNISNQITKYEITVNTQVELLSLKTGVMTEFALTKSGFYDVSSKYSETLNQERNLIKLLVNEISEDILDNLSDDL
tara:strand:- start:387 stop:842 length:456 start_codon:yes stop_codon:yes gene_type:complete